MRPTDKVGRWGGEEFFFVLRHTDLKGVRHFAEVLRERIAETSLLFGRKRKIKVKMTMSLGVGPVGAR